MRGILLKIIAQLNKSHQYTHFYFIHLRKKFKASSIYEQAVSSLGVLVLRARGAPDKRWLNISWR
jgi:hypothetical protein